MSDEGQAAIEAAAKAMVERNGGSWDDVLRKTPLSSGPQAAHYRRAVKAAIRAWLAALPEWRLVSVRYLEDAVSDAYTVGQQGRDLDEPYLADPPPPPGLED